VTDTEQLDELQHLYKLFHDDLRFCGCGNPEEAYALVRDLLTLAPFHQDWRKVAGRIGGNDGDDGPYYLILYMLDAAGLIEHGGSVGGSWLTAKGVHYLDLMKRHEWDDFDDADGHGGSAGYPHEGKDCPPGCRHHHGPAKVTVSAGDLETVLAMFTPSTESEDQSARQLRNALGMGSL
jgi:hypothetical protein